MIKPPLQVLPPRKEPPLKRRPRREMTLVAGFQGFGGVVLCADSQETSGSYAKKSVNKIFTIDFRNWRFAIAGAGHAAYIDMVTQKLAWELENIEAYHFSDVQTTIGQILAEHYKTHVWPRGESRSEAEVEFLIVAQPRGQGQVLLFHTCETAVNWIQDSKTIGVGGYLADYLLDHLHVGGGDQFHLLAVAAYILKKARDYIEGCGKESKIYLFTLMGETIWLEDEELQALENILEGFDMATKELFGAITDVESKHSYDKAVERALDNFKGVEEAMRILVSEKTKQLNKFKLWKREFPEVGN